MLKNFWWPLEFSEALTTQPNQIKALGQDFALYRTEDGHARVVSDLCIHRGGALSDGTVKGDCIACPYHGWEYNTEGQCVKIPANQPGTPISKKARIDAYPTVEKYGLVWAFLGDLPEAERPALPALPHFDDDETYRRLQGDWTLNANYERVLENGMDIAHAPFVHGTAFGNPDEPEVEEYEVEQWEWGAAATVTLNPPPAQGKWNQLYDPGKPAGKRPGVKIRTAFFMPCITLLEVNLPFGLMVLYDFSIPVDDLHTLKKWVQLRTFFKTPEADQDSYDRVHKILVQDQRILEKQRPELVPFDVSAELHVKADAIQLAYRRMRQRALEMGWGIDTHKIESEYAHRIYTVIPSPARRAVPELASAWVAKEVPVKKVGKESANHGD